MAAHYPQAYLHNSVKLPERTYLLSNFNAVGRGSPAALRGKLPFAPYTSEAASTIMALGALGKGGNGPLHIPDQVC